MRVKKSNKEEVARLPHLQVINTHKATSCTKVKQNTTQNVNPKQKLGLVA